MRTPSATAQICFHESSHAVAGFLLGWQVDKIELYLDSAPGEPAGLTFLQGPPIASRCDAEAAIAVDLAGVAGEQAAWALKAYDDAYLEDTELPEVEFDPAKELLIPNGSTPSTAAVFDGYVSADTSEDLEHAEKIAAEWGPGIVAPLMLSYMRAWVAEWVQTGEFQTLMGRLAVRLIDDGNVSGTDVHALLTRTQRIFEISQKRS